MLNSSFKSFDEISQNLWLELENYIDYLEPSEKVMVKNAYKIIEEVYQDQQRDNGRYFLEHKMAVLKILSGIKLDKTSLIASMFSGIGLDDKMQEIINLHQFPKEIFGMVEDSNKITELLNISSHNHNEKNAENLRRMFVATGRDFRVFFIKIAERVDNLLTMDHIPAEKAKEIAEQALIIDAEIASRLGISILKNRIEDAAFKYLHPQIFSYMVGNQALNFANRNNLAKRLQNKTQNILSEKQFPYIEIMGRAKGYYAVYNKLYQKGKTLDQIYDLIALRVIVDDVSKCYQVLQQIHEIYPEHVERTKNYILEPKENGYQSIHTTVLDPESNTPFEFQIRTPQMHAIAEYGAAAHWAYKKKTKNVNGLSFLDPVQLMKLGENLRRGAWNIFMKQNQFENKTMEFNLFQEKLFVLTPKGDVISLPQNSTALDYAYKIHEEIGNKAAYVKVNGKVTNLQTNLKTGDTVEIITEKQQSPKYYWLKWAKTSAAQKMIKSYLKEHQA
jgi:GTP diphosphokinase / guanosine-3',5'-bis(diphosphate) 3'-diphosphatase